MKSLRQVMIIYDEALRPDVMEALHEHGIQHYTRWTGVVGEGETGPRHGDPVWPGLNDVLLTVVEESTVAPLVETLHQVRDSFTVRPGLRFIITEVTLI